MTSAPVSPVQRIAHGIAAFAWLALILLCAAWEWQLAPLRPGGSWLVLKAALLLLPVAGVVRGTVDVMQWALLLGLLYTLEGAVRMFEAPPVRMLAIAELTLSAVFFGAAIVYLRPFKRAARKRRALEVNP